MHDHAHDDPHDLGLAHDLPLLLGRRRLLLLAAGATLAPLLAACGGDGAATGAAGSTAAATTATAASSAGAADCLAVIPEETAGPYPADGSNGIDVLTESGVVREDIRPSFGASTTVADGVPLVIELTVLDAANGCAPYAGAAVYLWHADREGRYSLYDQALPDENYLRGVGVADAQGVVRFATIFPGCYAGRWPHAHFEVYPDVAAATSASDPVATSQLAFPQTTCEAIYASAGYEQSLANLGQVSLATDMVFADGAEAETPAMSGDPATGCTAALTLAV